MGEVTGILDGKTLTVRLAGRIDTTNATETEKEINRCREENSYESLVLDAEELLYTSSVGLRMILRLKKAEPDFKIINASSEVYDTLEMTGFTEMIPVEKAYRKLSVDGCAVIGKGAKGTVYRYNPDTIVKVYMNPDSLPDIHRERELARKAFVLGIPTAISYDVVKVGDSYGSVFELLDAASFSQLIAEDPENIEKYVFLYADLLNQIHKTLVKKEDMPDVKDLIFKWVKEITPYFTEAEMQVIDRLVRDVPDTLNMLHCDYHTNNLMFQDGETLLIDMDTLAHGHPIFELANIYVTYVGFGERNPSVVEGFIGLDYDTAKKIWKIFLPRYLKTEDKEKLEEVEKKARFLSYIRMMRHTIRRDKNEEEIAYCRDKILTLMKEINTLEF